MKRTTAFLVAILLSGCATHSYEGRGLIVGQSSLAEITAKMGPPALQWTEVNSAKQLAYPRGPAGMHTYMVRVGPDGKLQSIKNVMEMSSFAEIKEGMSVDEVTKVLGPSVPHWTEYFQRRDELVWGWRYCDDWNQLARFFVLFDRTKGAVRSTMSLREDQVEGCASAVGGCWCGK